MKKYGYGKITNYGKVTIAQPATKETTAPIVTKDCKTLIYNLFAKPKYSELQITKKAYIKLMCYIHLIGEYEISGFGRIQNNIITDVKILKQEVRGAYVECSDDAVLQFIKSIPKEQLPEWELDWHSHVNMSTTPSSTDWKNYLEMSALKGYKQFPVLIINKKQEYTLMNYIGEDNSPDIDLEISDEEITPKEIDEIYAEVEKDIKENCLRRIVQTVNTATNTKIGFASKKQEKVSYPTYQRNWWDETDQAQEFVEYYCKSCGTQLLNSHELTTGLCEDCEEIVEEQRRKQNAKL